MSLDCLGATEIGFDITDGLSSIFQTAGGLTTGIASMVEKEQARKKTEAEEKSAIDAATAADQAAALAITRATVSAKLKGPGAAMDKTAADVAVSAADRAGSKLSSGGNDLRAEAANRARSAAIAAAQAAPKDGYKAALVDAWTSLINKAQAGAITTSDKGQGEAPRREGGSLLDKKIGPVPMWAAGVGGLAIAGVVAKKVLHLF